MSALPFNRKLSNTNIVVPAIGLGCMGMSPGIYGSSDDEESVKVLRHAVDIGCTFWDTSDAYGVGHNETLLARVLAEPGIRERVCLCTKFAIRGDIRQGGKGVTICGEPAYVREACQKSLERLGVDQIDLYYYHRKDKNVEIEDTVAAMAELVKEGKVKYIGLSEMTAATIRRAHKVHPITALQVEYSPWTLDIEHNGVLETCRELGIAIVAYSPLGRGFLTGNLKRPEDIPENDFRRSNPRFQGENFYKNMAVVDKLKGLASAKGCTVGQLTLAWVMAQGKDFFLIPGTKKLHYLDENFGAKDVILTKDEMQQIREIAEKAEIAGGRYSAAALEAMGQD